MARKQWHEYEGVFYTYIHRRKSDGEVFYVGKGTRDRAWDKYSRNIHWKRVFEKHGVIIEIVEIFSNESDAFASEIELIKLYSSSFLTNMTDGGEGVSGLEVSDETRKKLSAARVGNSNAKGKKWSQSSRDRASQSQKNKVFTEDHKRNISSGLRLSYSEGRRPGITEDTKRKISKANKGRSCADPKKISMATKGERHRLYDPTLWVFSHASHGVVICTKSRLRDDFSVPLSDVSAVVAGRQKSAKGWYCNGRA